MSLFNDSKIKKLQIMFSSSELTNSLLEINNSDMLNIQKCDEKKVQEWYQRQGADLA